MVLTLAKDSETLEDIVVYVTLYHNPEKETRVWTRPLYDFLGIKTLENGEIINRFELISNR